MHTKHMLRVTAGGMVACPTSLHSASEGLQTCREAAIKFSHRCKEASGWILLAASDRSLHAACTSKGREQ